MQLIICSLGALAIACIYYWYRSYWQKELGRRQKLRKRIAFLLWVAANH